MVVVALGEPGAPVTCWAVLGLEMIITKAANAAQTNGSRLWILIFLTSLIS
jgi:hypothetical protein